MGEQDYSPSSSTDSSGVPLIPMASVCEFRSDLSTDLRLGIGIPASPLQENTFCSNSSYRDRDHYFSSWPPIKKHLRNTLEKEKEKEKGNQQHASTFFVKVYMEGIPIGRKVNLLAHNGYDGIITTLCCMFRTTIQDPNLGLEPSRKAHVLAYQDKEGDWMMVGDVPWEFFLTTVKRLKIIRPDWC